MSKNGIRAIGLLVIVFNLWLVGRYSVGPLATLALTFGVAVTWEVLAVRATNENLPLPGALVMAAFIGGLSWLIASSTQSIGNSVPAASSDATLPLPREPAAQPQPAASSVQPAGTIPAQDEEPSEIVASVPQPQPQPMLLKFQCNGTYTQRDQGNPLELSLNGASIEISDTHVNVSGAGVFDGSLRIINNLQNGIGFQSEQDETISGFFNRFSGELSLLDRIGPKNADGSFQLSTNSSLKCQNASPMF